MTTAADRIYAAQTLSLPLLSLGGTPKGRLVDGLCEASSALRLALKAVEETCPDGRDYARIGPDALATATAEHRSRMDRLRAVLTEIEALKVGVDRGGYCRGERERVAVPAL